MLTQRAPAQLLPKTTSPLRQKLPELKAEPLWELQEKEAQEKEDARARARAISTSLFLSSEDEFLTL